MIKDLLPIKNKGKRLVKVATFDIETTPDFNAIACGTFINDNCYIFEKRTCVEQFLRFILNKRFRSYRFYAHNGSKFDFNYLFEVIQKLQSTHNFSVDIIKAQSRILKITLKYKNMCFYFLDSVSILPASLKNLTKCFNVEHKKLEVDYENIENDPNLIPYLASDCIGLYEVIDEFRKIFHKWNVDLKLTIAQQSMATFRTSFLKYSIPSHRSIESFIRKTYYGGRTEVFKKYGKNLYYYDFNSLYPSIMFDYEMPIGKPIKSYGKPPNKDFITFCKVKVETPKDLEIPILPVRHNKLVFPLGKFSGWYDYDEIKLAEQHGYKIKYYHSYQFPKDMLFKEYVQHFYDIKKNTKDETMYYISKLLLNSLYGKFGQRRHTTKMIFYPKKLVGLIPYREDLGIYEKKTISFSSHILPAIASHITALSRVKLYKAFEKAGLDKTYYCDTDSIVTKSKLPTSNKLGELKLEHKIKEGYFILPKSYYLVNHNKQVITRMKGFSKDWIKKNIDKSSFEKAILGKFDDFNYSEKKFGTIFENIRRNKNIVSKINLIKSVQSSYDKRQMIDQINTIPLSVSLD